MAKFNFNASDVPQEEPRTYAPLPAGDYECMVIQSDVKATKAGTGHYIELVIQVISGTSSGRRIFERLNIDNPNKQAESIAKASLARLCGAVGVNDMEDTQDLHDIPFIAEVGIDKKDDTRNVIWNYKAAIENTKPVVNNHKPAPSAAPAKAARPWG